MPFLIALLGLLAALAYWWHSAKAAGQAVNEAADTVGRVRGKMRRNRIRRTAEASPVTAIDQPLHAAATIILAILSDGYALPRSADKAVTEETIAKLASSREEAEEAAIFAEWAVGQMRCDTLAVISGAAPFLADRLSDNEKHRLIFLLDGAVKKTGTPPNYQYMTNKLAAALGITLARQTETAF